MSRVSSRRAAPVFAALGDETRLELVARLVDGKPRSITELSEGIALTRQAVTKHLRVLADAGIAKRMRVGRESRFSMQPKAIGGARDYLDRISAQWDDAMERLRSQVDE